MSSVESVIHYRLLGRDHPAATGERFLGSFSGETVVASKFLATLIQKHYINDSAYKLEVRVRSAGSIDTAANRILYPHDILHNYDQLEITIVRKQFADAAKEFQKGNASSMPALTSSELPGLEEATGGPHTSSQAKSEIEDEWMLGRMQALLKKKLPVCPGCVAQENEVAGVCLLCDLPIVDGIKLPCCRFTVCKGCNYAASTMLNDPKCPVCGTSLSTSLSSSSFSGSPYSRGGRSGATKNEDRDESMFRGMGVPRNPIPRNGESLKMENIPGSSPDAPYPFSASGDPAAPLWVEARHGTLQTATPSPSSFPASGRGNTALRPEVAHFLNTLQGSLDRSLSMLDLPDPLPEESRRKRRRSEFLAKLDAVGK